MNLFCRTWRPFGVALMLTTSLACAELVQYTYVPDSAWIRDVSYEKTTDEDTGTLSIRMGDDPTVVRYFEVPESIWEAFKTTDSPGGYYTTYIRQQFERQYGKSRAEKFDSPIPIQTQINALCAFNEECEEVILQSIQRSHEEILVAAYAFTRTRIAAELVRAVGRGVSVDIKMDYNQAQIPGAQKILAWLAETGIPIELIYTEGEYSAMHNKFMVFDRRWVVSGSYNFTTTAQVSNWENLIWIDSTEMADQYAAAWDAIVSDDPPPPKKPKEPRKKKATEKEPILLAE